MWISIGFDGASQVALVVKNLPANVGDTRDTGSIPGSGRSSGGEHGNPRQYSCLENPMDRGAWRAIVCRVTKSQTRLNQLSMHAQVLFSSLNLLTTPAEGRTQPGQVCLSRCVPNRASPPLKVTLLGPT